ncbi:Vacuolar proton translocating ATPase 100 kDa subunit [Diplonema papillatum]|nr:Vacuolar proton translocating ATPase 100 kDa subunit [Diplonema papillatum]
MPGIDAFFRDDPNEEAASGMFRSQDMKLVSIAFERDRVKKDLLALGSLGVVQFCDMNKDCLSFGKENTRDVRRCEGAFRKLRLFEEELRRWEPASGWPIGQATGLAHKDTALEDMERSLDVLCPELDNEVRRNNELTQNWLAYYEGFHVMASDNINVLTESATGGGLHLLAGTIPSSKVGIFERLAFRTSHGYCKTSLSPLPPPERSENLHIAEAGSLLPEAEVQRHLFVCVFHAQNVGSRLRKLAHSMEARIALDDATSEQQRREKEKKNYDDLADCSVMLVKSKSSIQNLLINKVCPRLRDWEHTVVVHKAIAHTMNMLQIRAHSAIAVCWVPACKIPEVKRHLRSETLLMDLDLPSHVMPPTYFEPNKYIDAFQAIVNSYGAPRYKEVNPAVFTIVTFPFLFGVMYGDIGHGLMVTVAAAIMILMEKSLGASRLNEMVAMIFDARYLLFLMGLFATWYGFLYNDTFGLMLSYSESGYQMTSPENTTLVNMTHSSFVSFGNQGCGYETRTNEAGVEYIWRQLCQECGVNHSETLDDLYSPPTFGVDSAWTMGSHKLDFFNSMKMKNAIILGVIQMLLGLVLQYMNSRYWKDWKHIYFGFIPEVIFLSCTFGYMSLLIVIKWLTPFQDACGVSLLETMVNFFLSPGKLAGPKGDLSLYPGQAQVQVFLLIISFLAVILLMLVPIPYIEWAYHNKSSRQGESSSLLPRRREDEEEMDSVEGRSTNSQFMHGDSIANQLFPPPAPHFDMQEIVIKQVIHTIEFVLGTVSNTASYLRLWALSLAHAQLSDVCLPL